MQPYQAPNPLSEKEIKSLSLEELINRMDNIRFSIQVEKYGLEWASIQDRHKFFPRVIDLLNTSKGRLLGEKRARKLVDAAFRYLLQMDMLSSNLGMMNEMIYRHEKSNSWQSPRHWTRAAALKQYQIVASRIALECFFDLMHIADRGERMSGNSKFKAFRKWVLATSTPYKYFVGHIIQAFEYDRNLRQKEVHGTSRFSQSILKLEKPDSAELNDFMELYNILLSVWKPLIQIMNDEKLSGIFNNVGWSENFALEHVESKEYPAEFEAFVKQLIEGRFN